MKKIIALLLIANLSAASSQGASAYDRNPGTTNSKIEIYMQKFTAMINSSSNDSTKIGSRIFKPSEVRAAKKRVDANTKGKVTRSMAIEKEFNAFKDAILSRSY